MHFYESMVITSKDGMQLKSYANEHPPGFVIAKPKYIPSDRISSDSFQKRELLGVPVHRFDYWAATEQELQSYLERFKAAFPEYIHHSQEHARWFFGVPVAKIASSPDPRQGVRTLMKRDPAELDVYMRRVHELLTIFHDHGLPYAAMGTTNSTLLGTYTHGRSDIDIMIFGKQNYWKFFHFMADVTHPLLRWRTVEEWKKYYATYNAGLNFSEEEFIWQAMRKRGDALFDNIVFSVFGVEEPGETAVKWGEEQYTPLGQVTVMGKVTDAHHSIVRPGFYQIEDSAVIEGRDVNVSKVVTFARDFMAQAFEGETIAARGVLEKVTSNNGDYYRVVVGYFDSYFTKRGEEFIKVRRQHATGPPEG